MRKNAWLKYCIYILLLSAVIFMKEYVIGKLEFSYERYLGAGNSYMLIITIPFVFNLIIGLLFGTEHFLLEIKKAGTWRINIAKLVLVGLPALFFSLTYHIASIDTPFVHKLLKFTTLGTNFISVFQIVLGYVIITSMHKEKMKISYKIKY